MELEDHICEGLKLKKARFLYLKVLLPVARNNWDMNLDAKTVS